MIKEGPVSKLKEELRDKEKELAEIKSLMLRKAAEFDNARKRWEREREIIAQEASAQVLKELLEVWDNFERALEIKTDGNSDNTLEAYRKGVELIFTHFTDALAKQGLKQYSCMGEMFNPALAEALGHYETTDAEPGVVIEEVRKGFLLGDRVLRPARVIVAKEIEKPVEEKQDSQAGDESTRSSEI